MKPKKSVWQIVHRCIIALMFVCVCWSCDEVEPLVPEPEKVEGEVEFVINVNNNDSISGGDVIDEPTTVTQGDTLNMVVSQKSSYTDPDGTVFTCEPKATIELFATVDTIYAKDIETLLKINENADVTMDQSGSNPVLYTINQKFMIGEQEVVFDLGHEVYSYVNSLSNVIEMPYVKVNKAKLGSGNVSENGDGTRSSSPYVTLRALSLTRASITDSTMFEVSAKFNLELESVNTKNENKETLEFNVNYVGVVENVTELYGSVVYTINDKNGEVKSPFVVNGSDSLLLEIKEKSTFATPDTSVYAFEPMASISLKVKNDTAFVEKSELLTALIETEEPKVFENGENPITNLYEKVFATSSQEFLFNTMYEVYTAQSGDEMPYLMIGEPKCIDIKITEQKKDDATRAIVYDTVYYDVKARFEIELKGVNVSDELVETLEFEVNYVGGVINATHIVELVKTTYRKNQVFYEGYGTLWPRSQCEVYRDRHYSDGHVETDEFFGAPWFWIENNVYCFVSESFLDGDTIYDSVVAKDSTIVFSPNLTLRYGDIINSIDIRYNHLKVYSSIQVPDIEFFQYIEKESWQSSVDTILEYGAKYKKELTNEPFDFDNPIEGWYVDEFIKNCKRNLKYVKNGENINFRYFMIFARFYDRFFCIDDTIIGFEEYRPELIWTDGFEDFEGNETKGPGKIFKFEVKGLYLEQPVYVAIVDTLYTPKN